MIKTSTDSNAYLVEEYQWIAVSLFFQMNKWNLLFKEIEQMKQRINCEKILYFQILFNSKNGENIRMALLVSDNHFQTVASEVNDMFQCFFSDYHEDNFQSPIVGIFLPFPTSTIQFGLYSKNYDNLSLSKYKKQDHLSTIILEALHDEDINLETIISFSFYLQIVLVKVCLKHLGNEVQNIFSLLTRTNSKSILAEVENMLEKNGENLYEVTVQLMNSDHFESSIDWVSNWYVFNDLLLNERIATRDSNKEFIKTIVKDFYEETLFMIHEHLQHDHITTDFLYHCINQSISKYYENNTG